MSEINKDELYGRYQKHQDAQNKLALQVAHKALDEPQDDMNIKADRTTITNGIGPLGLIGTTLASGLLGASGVGAAALLFGLLGRPSVAPMPPPQTIPITRPAREYDVIYEELQPDGTWKEVRREPLTLTKDRR